MFQVAAKIKQCRLEILKWNRLQCSNTTRKIQGIKNEMEALRVQEGNRDWDRWTELRIQLGEAYKEEEAYWYQKARVQ